MFLDRYIRKLAEFENIMNYINNYQAIYNKMVSFAKPESRIQIEMFEVFLLANIVRNLASEYFGLVCLI